MPHAPQFRGSVVGSTQRAPHVVSAQVALHAPFEQKGVVAGQLVAQLPHVAGSPIRFRHSFPHALYGGVHAHRPLWQNWPITHALPHSPQFVELV